MDLPPYGGHLISWVLCGVFIEDHGQVQETDPGRHIGDVRQPQQVRTVNREIPLYGSLEGCGVVLAWVRTLFCGCCRS